MRKMPKPIFMMICIGLGMIIMVMDWITTIITLLIGAYFILDIPVDNSNRMWYNKSKPQKPEAEDDN